MADDWFGGAGDEEGPHELKAFKKMSKQEDAPPEVTQQPAEGEAPPGEGEGEDKKEEAADEEYLDPDKLLLFKHWIRPKFLPYKYLYMYRKNYYDDVMDYLDKRSRGIPREIPHAQTWAERIMRTYSDKVMKYRTYTRRIREDMDMVEKTRSSGNFFYYHVKSLFDRQFSPLLH